MLPIFLYYPFLSAPISSLQKDVNRYLSDLKQLYPNSLTVDLHTSSIKPALLSVLNCSLKALGVSNSEISNLSDTFLQLAKARLKNLYATYMPEVVINNDIFDDFQTVMGLKNRMSSHLFRLTNAPDEIVIEQAKEKLQTIITSMGSLYDIAQLETMENTFLGLTYSSDSMEQRADRLFDMFKHMKPFIKQKRLASRRLMAQWQEHSLDCRRVKLFYLLAQDLARLQLHQDVSPITWEDFDEVLTKLEIALLAKFRFRSPRRVEIRSGEPIDVSQFVTENNKLPRKALLQALTQKSYKTIQKLMGDQ